MIFISAFEHQWKFTSPLWFRNFIFVLIKPKNYKATHAPISFPLYQVYSLMSLVPLYQVYPLMSLVHVLLSLPYQRKILEIYNFVFDGILKIYITDANND